MKIGIAIVHFGSQELLDNCLDSLKNEVFDNEAEIRIHDCNVNNIGFSAGNNSLIKEFLHGDEEWIWLLNNDTTVPKETLDFILAQLENIDKEVGVLGFQIGSMQDPDFIHHAGTADCYPGGVHKSGSVKLGQYDKRTFEKWVTFASVLIRREVFESIGLLDEHMFNYYSDSDFCFRARYSGWKIQYVPELVVYHKIGSSQNPSPEQMHIIRNDQIAFENKWLNGKTFFDLDKEVV